MEPTPRDLAAAFWRRTLLGPHAGARIVLYEQLRSLLAAGVPVTEAIAETARRSGGARRAALEAVSADLSRGATPGAALLLHPERFTPIEGHLVAAGDLTGRWDRAFADAAEHLERVRRDVRRVVASALYPTIVLHCALCLSVFLGGGGPGRLLFLLALLWGAVAALLTFHASAARNERWGRALASIPLFGGSLRDAAVGRAASAAAALFGAGAGLPESLRAAGDCAGNGWVRAGLVAASERVRAGTPVAEAVSSVGALTDDERALVAAGERSGDLDRTLERVAGMARDRSEASMTRNVVVVYVGMILVAGLWVAAMAFSTFGRLYQGL